MLKNLVKWIEKNEGLILILLLVILLRIPSLYEPYWYGDEGIYLILGQALRKGLVWYRDIHDNKPPLLYLMASLTGTVFYFRLLLIFWFGATTIFFYRLMQVLLPKNRLAWYFSTLSMIGLTTATEGNIANGEIFMILPIILGFLLILQKKLWLLSGILFSLGFLFKVPAIFDLAAAGLFLLLIERVECKKIGWLILGFGLPIAITIIYYAFAGGLEPYVRSALMQNIGYLSSWDSGQSGLAGRAIVLTISLGTIFICGKKFKLPKMAVLTCWWFLMALFGALLSGRPYPHYLIQPAIPGAILVSWLIFSKNKKLKILILGIIALTTMAYVQIKFWSYPIAAYYKNFGNYLSKKKSVDDYWLFFDDKVKQTYSVAAYLQEKTLPKDRIFIWGDEPMIYALSKRLPVGRYTVAYHVIDFNGYQETMKAWGKNPPKVVIVMDYEIKKFPEMENKLNNDYLFVDKIEHALIYRFWENK